MRLAVLLIAVDALAAGCGRVASLVFSTASHIQLSLQITAADIPTTPTATTCKANLDAAAAAFAAAGNAITGVKQIAGASKSNYVRH